MAQAGQRLCFRRRYRCPACPASRPCRRRSPYHPYTRTRTRTRTRARARACARARTRTGIPIPTPTPTRTPTPKQVANVKEANIADELLSESWKEEEGER